LQAVRPPAELLPYLRPEEPDAFRSRCIGLQDACTHGLWRAAGIILTSLFHIDAHNALLTWGQKHIQHVHITR
jgi:hypothetical protein